MTGKERTVSSFTYIPQLDTVRFMAFILIFIHHTNKVQVPGFSQLQDIGWVGVDVFLCLSSFLLMNLLLDEVEQLGGINIGKYFIRRILRIWPLYFAYLLFIVFILLITSGIPGNNIFRLLTLATFTDNIASAIYGYNTLSATAHLWTISYEEQFYLILPFVVLLISRLSPKANGLLLGVVISIGLLSRFLFVTWNVPHPAVWVLPLTHFESIVAGCLMAYFNDRIRAIPILPLAVVVVTTVLILIWVSPVSENGYSFSIAYTSAALFSFAIVAISIKDSPEWLKQVTSFRPFQYLGKVSYGLYVFHSLALVVAYHYQFSKSEAINGLLALLLCIIAAIASYELFERRILKLKNARYKVIGK